MKKIKLFLISIFILGSLLIMAEPCVLNYNIEISAVIDQYNVNINHCNTYHSGAVYCIQEAELQYSSGIDSANSSFFGCLNNFNNQ